MKKRISALLLCLVICLSLFSAGVVTVKADFAGDYESREYGYEEDNPYLISTLADLEYLAELVNDGSGFYGCYFRLTADVGPLTTPIGSRNHPFSGHFNGGGHTVTLSIIMEDSRLEESSSAGLFGCIGYDGVVENVVTAGDVLGGDSVGGVCGENFYGTIRNCHNAAGVTSTLDAAGGICGTNNGDIQNCYNSGSVTGSAYIGGVCGDNCGTVESCYYDRQTSGCGDPDAAPLYTAQCRAAAGRGYLVDRLNGYRDETGGYPESWVSWAVKGGIGYPALSYPPFINAPLHNPTHVHGQWQYSASGSTLTAVCGASGCGSTAFSVSLTLLPPADKVYDGTPIAPAALTGDTDLWTSVFGSLPTVRYCQGSTDLGTTSPANAGSYTAQITAGSGTAKAAFTVSPDPAGATAPTLFISANETAVFYPGDTISVVFTAADAADCAGEITVSYPSAYLTFDKKSSTGLPADAVNSVDHYKDGSGTVRLIFPDIPAGAERGFFTLAFTVNSADTLPETVDIAIAESAFVSGDAAMSSESVPGRHSPESGRVTVKLSGFTVDTRIVNGAYHEADKEFVFTDYVAGYVRLEVTGSASGCTFDGKDMFLTKTGSGLNTFSILFRPADYADIVYAVNADGVTVSLSEASVRSLLKASDAPDPAHDLVTGAGRFEISDVRAAFNCQNLDRYSPEAYMAVFLRADVTANGIVDAGDVNALVAARLG